MPPTDQQIVKGPDGKTYKFPKGTTKDQAIGYFKKKGIGAPPKQQESPYLGPEADLAKGFVKGAADTALLVSKGLNKLPYVGKFLAPSSGIEAAEKMTTSSNIVQSVGKGAEAVAEFVAGGEALEALGAAIKAKNIPTVMKIVQKYPYLAKYASIGLKNYALGAGQGLAHGDANPNRAGVVTAAAGVGGEYASSLFSKYAPKAATKTYEAMNRYLGLSRNDMPKWSRLNAGDVRDIGKTVINEVGIKGSIEEQAHAIEAGMTNVQERTTALLKNEATKSIPLRARLEAIGNEIAEAAERKGNMGNREQINEAVQKNKEWVIDKVRNKYGTPSPYMSAQDVLELRRTIDKGINWNQYGGDSDIEQMFRSELRSALNDDIKLSLQPEAATEFERLNKVQSRLIVARTAANRAVVKEGLGGKSVGAVSGAMLGGYEGYTHGGVKGAIVGAVSGAAGGATIGKAITDPKTQLLARKGIQHLLPMLQAIADKSPAVASSLQTVLSTGSGSIGSNR